MASLDRRLFGSMGCSGLERKICGAVASAGLTATIGIGTGIDPEEIVHSRYIVLWGTNTIVTNLHFWPLVREAQRRGARSRGGGSGPDTDRRGRRLAPADPAGQRRRAGARDDARHDSRRPRGSRLRVAAMPSATRRSSSGRATTRRRRSRDTVGLPADDIERFAREYATTQPSLLRPLIGIEHHRNGAMQFRTMACLPVLSGAWRHRGGGLARSTHALQFAVLDMDSVLRPEVHKPGVRVLNMRDLGKDLCSDTLQPPMRALMVYGANPMVSMPNQERVREGLLRDDLFTVVHDLFVTDTALYADYVLPATSQIEHLDLVARVGPPVSRAEPPGDRAAWRVDVEHRALPPAGRGARAHRAVAVRERRVDAARRARERPSVARRASPTSGCGKKGYVRLNRPEDWRPFANGGFPTPSREGGALLRWPLREAGPRSAAVAGRDSRRRPACS